MTQSMGVRVEGFIITSVDRDSPAAEAELQRGMAITSIDGQAVTSVVKAAKILYGKGKGDRVRLEVVVPRQRGSMVQYLQGTVELNL